MFSDHKHRCDCCDIVWEHPDYCADSHEDHVCPNCGQEQWWKCEYSADVDYAFVDLGVYEKV